MKIPRIKPMFVPLTGFWFIIGVQYIHTPAGLVAATAGEVLFIGWAAWSFCTEDPKVKAERELQARQARIAELEKDLGYEPLNLHELDEILLDPEYRKEKDA